MSNISLRPWFSSVNGCFPSLSPSIILQQASMEVEGEDGTSIHLERDAPTVFGRGSGFNTTDRTVSRRHVVFQPLDKGVGQTETRVSFQVIGKNPVWVRSCYESGNDALRVFRRFEKGEVATGDWFCCSSQSPVWFHLRARTVESDNGNEPYERSNEFSDIDPVKEFGFLVIGHEFDIYPKNRTRHAKNWDWFLEEAERGSEEDDESYSRKKKRNGIGKRKKKNVGKAEDDNDDNDWTGESEDDKAVVAKTRKISRPRYLTRSKEGKKPHSRDTEMKKGHQREQSMSLDEDNDDETDETLGGFIVADVDEDEGAEENESDEEEEFMEDEEEEE